MFRKLRQDGLWASYRATRDDAARGQLLEQHLGLVYHCARQLTRRGTNAVEMEDLVSAGTLGLIRAVERFEPAQGHAFSTYAVLHIRGAMLDELRSRDSLPRSVRQRLRNLDRARVKLQASCGEAPSHRDVAAAMGISMNEYWETRDRTAEGAGSPLDIDDLEGHQCRGPLEATLADTQVESPDVSLERDEQIQWVRTSIEALAPQERSVLALYYFEELTLREVGEVLGVTESRACQIRSRAMRRLREQMRSRTPSAA